MKFKRIYIEITNICNLKCSFCSNSKRNKKEMSIDEFELVMSKITMYTDYIYLHVKGETLSHHYLDDILSICKKYNKKVCITTNGVFLKDRLDILSKYDNIYQINISLHSENNKDNYLEDIFEVVQSIIGVLQGSDITKIELPISDNPLEIINELKQCVQNWFTLHVDDIEYEGARSLTSSFLSDIHKYVYLFRLDKCSTADYGQDQKLPNPDAGLCGVNNTYAVKF